jgi:hypothetical protein
MKNTDDSTLLTMIRTNQFIYTPFKALVLIKFPFDTYKRNSTLEQE